MASSFIVTRGELAAGRNPAEAREVADLAGHSRASESLTPTAT